MFACSVEIKEKSVDRKNACSQLVKSVKFAIFWRGPCYVRLFTVHNPRNWSNDGFYNVFGQLFLQRMGTSLCYKLKSECSFVLKETSLSVCIHLIIRGIVVLKSITVLTCLISHKPSRIEVY